jgi:hypothetical protein
MWIASHVGVGSLIYETVKDEPKWAKWSVVVAGGFVSHWVLDEVSTYHTLSFNHWYDIMFIALNAVSVSLIWWSSGRGLTGRARLLPPQFLAGLIAWLIWDWEWFAGSQGRWIHLSGIFPRYVRDVYALDSSYIQISLITMLTVVVVKPWRLRAKDFALGVNIHWLKAPWAHQHRRHAIASSKLGRGSTGSGTCPAPVHVPSQSP